MAFLSGDVSGSLVDAESQFNSGSGSGYGYGQAPDPFSQGMQQNLWDSSQNAYRGGGDPRANQAGNAWNRMNAGLPGAGDRMDRTYDAVQPNYMGQVGGGRFDSPWNQGQGSMVNAQNQMMQNQGAQGLQDAILAGQQGPSQMGMMYQDIVGGPGNTYMDPMVDALRDDYGTSFREEFLPGVTNSAINAGGLGSSRQGVAEAVGGAKYGQNFARDAATMRGQGYETDMNWKMNIASMADQSQQQNLDRMYNMWDAGNLSQQTALDRQGGFGQEANATTQWGIGAAPGMNDLAQGRIQMEQNAAMSPWEPLGYMSQFQNQYRPNITESGQGDASAFANAGSRFNSGDFSGGFSFL